MDESIETELNRLREIAEMSDSEVLALWPSPLPPHVNAKVLRGKMAMSIDELHATIDTPSCSDWLAQRCYAELARRESPEKLATALEGQ